MAEKKQAVKKESLSLKDRLVKALAEVKTPGKTGVNTYFNTNYATIDDVFVVVKKALTNNGLALLQGIKTVEYCEKPWFILQTGVTDGTETCILDERPISFNQKTPQDIGKYETCMRRYAINCAFCLGGETEEQSLEDPNKKENILLTTLRQRYSEAMQLGADSKQLLQINDMFHKSLEYCTDEELANIIQAYNNIIAELKNSQNNQMTMM